MRRPLKVESLTILEFFILRHSDGIEDAEVKEIVILLGLNLFSRVKSLEQLCQE